MQLGLAQQVLQRLAHQFFSSHKKKGGTTGLGSPVAPWRA